MQTQTAYRPHSLPTSFPPPRNTGVPDTSIAADFPSTPFQPAPEQQGASSNISVRENEAQKSKPVESKPAAAPKPAEKPRRKLRPRKAAMKLTPLAIEQLRKLISQPDPKFIRVGVKNKGCSGLAYHLEYVEKPGTFDEVVEQEGVKVLIDSKALFSIIGSEMDWQEDKLSKRFVFRNPNISRSPYFILGSEHNTNASHQRNHADAVNPSWCNGLIPSRFSISFSRSLLYTVHRTAFLDFDGSWVSGFFLHYIADYTSLIPRSYLTRCLFLCVMLGLLYPLVSGYHDTYRIIATGFVQY